MRLWHYKLLPYLPKLQLISQWRELNSVFKKQDKNILINYVYEYPKLNLWAYTCLVTNEMKKRGFKISEKSSKNADDYFGDIYATLDEAKAIKNQNPFPNHHNNRYLLQCFYNLQEKYDRGQKDFDVETFKELVIFVDVEINDHCDLLLNLKEEM